MHLTLVIIICALMGIIHSLAFLIVLCFGQDTSLIHHRDLELYRSYFKTSKCLVRFFEKKKSNIPIRMYNVAWQKIKIGKIVTLEKLW